MSQRSCEDLILATAEYSPIRSSIRLMISGIRIREFCFPADYEPVFALWRSIERGVHTGRSDTLAEIEKKLARDPDLFLVAESDGAIIGSVIGGYDGRRGLVYHL
ncbi:MAG TPA: hypothetical protein VFS61_11040, partial [Anaerolineales bacterium]|nr:hypothetical protein [Anaerolineales bacterium]